METQDKPKDNRITLLTHYWDINSKDYKCQFSFIWNHNDVKVDIRSFNPPPGKERCVHFNFSINGVYTLFKFHYNAYGGGPEGKTPELVSENFRLSFFAGPKSLTVYEERIGPDAGKGKQLDMVQ